MVETAERISLLTLIFERYLVLLPPHGETNFVQVRSSKWNKNPEFL